MSTLCQLQNVIRAMEVPEPLLVLQEAADMPMLAMEYCSEGDLRNVSVCKHLLFPSFFQRGES